MIVWDEYFPTLVDCVVEVSIKLVGDILLLLFITICSI